jgi:phage-related protein
MAVYDMGTAHGRIRIDYEGDGFRQTEEGFRRAHDSSEQAGSSFLRTAKKLGLFTSVLAAFTPGAVAMSAAVVAAGGATTAAFGAALGALGAFRAAVAPQFAAIKSVTQSYEQAQKAAAEGSADAAEKMKAYKDALAQLPSATRATAVAFIGLKEDFKNWSNSLADDTMPIFTRGINLLRRILPTLSPLVRVAASALSDFLGGIEQGVANGGLKAFIDRITEVAAVTLPAFLNSAKNIGSGLAGIFEAFLPSSGQMATNIEGLTARFAAWGQQLGSSGGFQSFMENMRTNGPQVASLLGSLGTIIGNLVATFAPFAGASVVLTTALAGIVAAIPVPVLQALALTITTVTLATRLWAAAQVIATAATKAWALANRILTISMLSIPVVALVAAIVALIAIFVLAWKNSDTFRRVVTTAFNAVKEAVLTAVGFIVKFLRNNWRLIISIMLGPLGIMVALVTKHWRQIWNFIQTAVRAILNVISNFGKGIRTTFSAIGAIVGIISGIFSRAVSAVRSRVSSLLSIVRGIPRSIRSFFSGASSWLSDAGRRIIDGLLSGIRSALGRVRSLLNSVTDMIPDWKGPERKDRKLLTKNGRVIMLSLVRGFQRELPQLKRLLGGPVTRVIQTGVVQTPQGAGGGLEFRTAAQRRTVVEGPNYKELARQLGIILNENFKTVGNGPYVIQMDGRVVTDVVNRRSGRQAAQQRRTR